MLAWASAALQSPAPAVTSHPGSVTPAGRRRNNNRIRSLSATLDDANGVTAINSVTFQIARADRTIRFTHTIYEVATTLPATSVIINATSLPTNFRAGSSNLLIVSVNYTDATGTHTATGEAAFTT